MDKFYPGISLHFTIKAIKALINCYFRAYNLANYDHVSTEDFKELKSDHDYVKDLSEVFEKY